MEYRVSLEQYNYSSCVMYTCRCTWCTCSVVKDHQKMAAVGSVYMTVGDHYTLEQIAILTTKDMQKSLFIAVYECCKWHFAFHSCRISSEGNKKILNRLVAEVKPHFKDVPSSLIKGIIMCTCTCTYQIQHTKSILSGVTQLLSDVILDTFVHHN